MVTRTTTVEPGANVAQTTSQKKGGRQKKVRNTRVEEYSVPLEEPAAQATKPAEQSEQSEEKFSDIDRLISRIDTEAEEGWSIRVDELPNFAKDGKWTHHSTEVRFKGYIPAVVDYDAIIQAWFGAGVYRCILIDPMKNWGEKWRITVDELPQAAAQAQAGKTANYFIQQPQPQQPQATEPPPSLLDRMKETRTLLTEISEIQKLVTPPASTSVTQPSEQTEQPTLKEKAEAVLLEKVIDHAFGTGEKDKIDRVFNHIIGTGEPEYTWPQLIKDFGLPLIQMAGPIVMRILQGNAVAASEVPLNTENTAQSDGDASSLQSALPAAPQKSLEPFDRLLRYILMTFANGFPAAAAYEALNTYSIRHPSDAQLQVFGQSPDVAAQLIATQTGANVDVALFTDFIAELQQIIEEERQQANESEQESENA